MSLLEISGLRFNYSDKELFNDLEFRLFASVLIDTLFNVKLDEFNQNNLGSNLR